MNMHMYGEGYTEEIATKRAESRKMLASFIAIAELALDLGGEVSFDWPKNCGGWLLDELVRFIIRNRLFVAIVDGCSLGVTDRHGVPALKRWRFLTPSSRMFDAITKFRCEHDPWFRHADLSNTDAQRAGLYPKRLCRAILA